MANLDKLSYKNIKGLTTQKCELGGACTFLFKMGMIEHFLQKIKCTQKTIFVTKMIIPNFYLRFYL